MPKKQAKLIHILKAIIAHLFAPTIAWIICKLIEYLSPEFKAQLSLLIWPYKFLLFIIVVILIEAIRRYWVEKKYKIGRARLREVNRFAKQHRHPVLFQAICDYLHRRIEEITKSHSLMNVSEYIDVLLASIRTRPKFVFATCVLTPDEWYKGTFHQSIQSYFNEQKLIRKSSIDCKMFRVILVESKELLKTDSDSSKYRETVVNLVNEHILASINIGLIDKEDSPEISFRDFALYGDDDGAWAIEAHGLHEAGAVQVAKVQLHECGSVSDLLSAVDRFSNATLPQDLKNQLMQTNPAITTDVLADCTINRFKGDITKFVSDIRKKI